MVSSPRNPTTLVTAVRGGDVAAARRVGGDPPGEDGATGVPAHLTLPVGVWLPGPAGVLAGGWTDLLAYPEGRALSWLDVITVVQRGVVTGELPVPARTSPLLPIY